MAAIRSLLRLLGRPLMTGLLLVIAAGPGCSSLSRSLLRQPDPAPLAGEESEPALPRTGSEPPAPPALPEPVVAAPEPRQPDEPVASSPEATARREIVPTARMYDIPIPRNNQVTAALKAFQTHGSRSLTDAFARARRYTGMMRTIFQEQGLPGDLINLAFIESSVNPRATSPANAAGIWQFLPSTARRYGMRRSSWVDERRDPEKSTRAAAGYLKHLYGQFKDWPLALAAYNAGEGAVWRAVKQQGSRDFWRLRLPKETQRFVPAFMAVTIIARDPERYGFLARPDEPHDTEILHVIRPTSIHLLAQAARTSVKQLRDLNPELVNVATPPDRSSYSLRIPRQITWISHTIQKGDTLSKIARQYEVSEQLLRETNRLGSPAVLKPGDVVLVPVIAMHPPV
jgi:membrane-bound lytic murein transglycosylase D